MIICVILLLTLLIIKQVICWVQAIKELTECRDSHDYFKLLYLTHQKSQICLGKLHVIKHCKTVISILLNLYAYCLKDNKALFPCQTMYCPMWCMHTIFSLCIGTTSLLFRKHRINISVLLFYNTLRATNLLEGILVSHCPSVHPSVPHLVSAL